jgi:hypothetical protein
MQNNVLRLSKFSDKKYSEEFKNKIKILKDKVNNENILSTLTKLKDLRKNIGEDSFKIVFGKYYTGKDSNIIKTEVLLNEGILKQLYEDYNVMNKNIEEIKDSLDDFQELHKLFDENDLKNNFKELYESDEEIHEKEIINNKLGA